MLKLKFKDLSLAIPIDLEVKTYDILPLHLISKEIF